jgi:hypothetical protein
LPYLLRQTHNAADGIVSLSMRHQNSITYSINAVIMPFFPGGIFKKPLKPLRLQCLRES